MVILRGLQYCCDWLQNGAVHQNHIAEVALSSVQVGPWGALKFKSERSAARYGQFAGQNFVHEDSNESDELLSPMSVILDESHSIDVLLNLGSD